MIPSSNPNKFNIDELITISYNIMLYSWINQLVMDELQHFQFMITRSKQPQRRLLKSEDKMCMRRYREKSIDEGEGPVKKIKRCEVELAKVVYSFSYDSIPFLPEIKLTAEQIDQDPLQILMQLQQKYSKYGAVKLVPPANWNPPFSMKYSKMGITTRIQPLNNLKIGKAFEQKKESYSLQSFKQMAEEFHRRYAYKFTAKGKNENARLQNEYWNLINGPTQDELQTNPKKYKITVEYAADLPVNKYGSGFPQHSQTKATLSSVSAYNYAQSLWNLNNLYKSNRSLLQISDEHEQHIGGITIPWLYMGMQFATFCWHVEDCLINSINYNHLGADKIWYFIPQGEKDRFDAFVERKYGRRDIMSKITYMVDPREIMAEGIQVYKTYQKAQQYVCTFFGAYHCGFSTGFNIGEAVNFVVSASMPYIKQLSPIKNASLFCYQWIIAKNYHSGLKTQVNNEYIQVEKEYKRIVKEQYESVRRVFDCAVVKEYEMVGEKVKYNKFVCHKCKNYLYLSFLICTKCNRNCCMSDTNICCSKPVYILMARVFDKQRKKIEQLIRSTLAE